MIIGIKEQLKSATSKSKAPMLACAVTSSKIKYGIIYYCHTTMISRLTNFVMAISSLAKYSLNGVVK